MKAPSRMCISSRCGHIFMQNCMYTSSAETILSIYMYWYELYIFIIWAVALAQYGRVMVLYVIKVSQSIVDHASGITICIKSDMTTRYSSLLLAMAIYTLLLKKYKNSLILMSIYIHTQNCVYTCIHHTVDYPYTSFGCHAYLHACLLQHDYVMPTYTRPVKEQSSVQITAIQCLHREFHSQNASTLVILVFPASSLIYHVKLYCFHGVITLYSTNWMSCGQLPMRQRLQVI